MRIPHLGIGTDGTDPRIAAVQYFVDRGMTPYGAIGLVGNLYRESNLSPDSVNSSSGAYGIAQWLGSRKRNLFAKYGNKPTLEQQLDFVWHELNSTHKTGRDRLNSAPTIEDAAKAGFGGYEFSVPWPDAIKEMDKHGQNGQRSMDEGIRYANEIYQLYAPRMQGKPTPEEAKFGIRPTNASRGITPTIQLQTPTLTAPSVSVPVISAPEPALTKPNRGRERRRMLFQNMAEILGLNDMFGL